jgi:cellulose synthase operon protein C
LGNVLAAERNAGRMPRDGSIFEMSSSDSTEPKGDAPAPNNEDANLGDGQSSEQPETKAGEGSIIDNIFARAREADDSNTEEHVDDSEPTVDHDSETIEAPRPLTDDAETIEAPKADYSDSGAAEDANADAGDEVIEDGDGGGIDEFEGADNTVELTADAIEEIGNTQEAAPSTVEIELADDDYSVVEVEIDDDSVLETIELDHGGSLVSSDPEPIEAESVVETDILGEAISRVSTDEARWAAMEELLADEAAADDDRGRRAVIHHELGYLFLQELGDEARAIKSFARALSIDPLLRANLWAIRRIFASRELWPNVLKLFEAQLRLEEDPAQRMDVLLDRGRVLFDRLEDTEQARASFWQAHEADEGSIGPLLALQGLAIETEDDTLLVEVAGKMVAIADNDAQRVALLRQHARLQLSVAEDAEAAWGALEEAYSLGVDALFTCGQMLVHARQTKSSDKQADILTRQAGLHAASSRNLEAVACLREAAWLTESRLENPERAFEILGDALELLESDSDEALALETHRTALAERLQKWNFLASSTERAFENCGEGDEEKGALALKLYRYRSAAKLSNASDALDLALSAVPNYLPALVAYERECLATADYDRLVETYEQEGNAALDGSFGGENEKAWAVDAYWRSAFVVASAGGDADRAIELCRKALALDNGHKGLQNLLAGLLEQHGRFEALYELLLERKDAGEKGLFPQLISLAGGALNDPQRQIGLLREYSQVHPDDRNIRIRLVEALTRENDGQALADALQRLQELETSDKQKNEIRIRRAEILASTADRKAEALELYVEVLTTDPGNAYALVGLELSHAQVDQLGILAAAIDVPGMPDDIRRNLRLKLAMQYELAAKNEEAIQIYDAMLGPAPDDENARAGLLRSAQADGNWKRVADLLAAELEKEGDSLAQSRRLLTLAELNEDVLGDSEQYEDLLKRIVENPAAPDRVIDAMDALVRRFIVRGDHAEAVNYLSTVAADAPPAAHDIFVEEQAWLLSQALGKAEEGASLWTRLKEKGVSASAIWALSERAAAGRDLSTLATLNNELSHAVVDKALAAQLCLRAGNFADLVGGRGHDASEAYRRALVLDEDCIEARWGLAAQEDLNAKERAENLEAIRTWLPEQAMQQLNLDSTLTLMHAGELDAAKKRLAPLLAKDSDHMPALALLQRIAESTGEERLEAQIWLKMGGLFAPESNARLQAWRAGAELLAKANAVDEAATVYRELIALGKNDQATYERLEELYQQLDANEQLEALYGHRLARLPADSVAKVDLYYLRAQLRLDKRDDTRGGARDLLALLELEPGHRFALARLASLFFDDEQFQRAEALYRRYFDRCDDRDEKCDALLKLVACGKTLNCLEPAAEACQQFLDLWPDDIDVWEISVGLQEKLGDHEAAVAALEKYAALQETPEMQAQSYARAAKLLQADEPDAAKAHLVKAHDLAPTDIDILGQLRSVCVAQGADGEVRQALDRCQDDLWEALSDDGLSVETIGKIMQVAEWSEDQHRLFTALGVLGFLGGSSASEEQLYQRRVELMRLKPGREIPAGRVHDALTLPPISSGLTAVWRCISFAMPKLFPDTVPGTPEMAGVEASEARLMRNSGGPASAAILQIAALLNVGEFDIYLSRNKPDIVTGICTEKYRALVVGHAVVSSMGAEQRFHAGRHLALLRDDAAALAILPRAEIESVIAAAIRLAAPKTTIPQCRDVPSRLVDRLEQALSRKKRKTLLGLVGELDTGSLDIGGWLDALLFGANRSGLLVCGDIRAALDLVGAVGESESAQVKPSPDDKDLAESALRQLKQNPQAVDLMRFAFSREHADLRRALGI